MVAKHRLSLGIALLTLVTSPSYAEGYRSFFDAPKDYSSLVSFGDMEDTRIDKNVFAKPIFVIGVDETSLNWLLAYRTRLDSIGAVGYVVGAENQSQVKYIREVSQYRLLFTVPNIERLLLDNGVNRYPVLLDFKNGIAKQRIAENEQ